MCLLLALGMSGLGLYAGVFTTRIRIQHEREEQLRDRMIAAADDFATGTLQAQMQMWEAAAVPSPRGKAEERKPTLTT